MSARKEAVIHIGTHKTGTTSFQHALVQSRDALAASGVQLVSDMASGQCRSLANEAVRPDLIFPGRVLNPDLLLPEARLEARRWLRDQFGGPASLAIVSDEALSFVRTTAEARRVRRLLGGRRARIVVVLRDRDEYLRSWGEQLESMGFPRSSRYAASFMNVAPDSWLADTDQLVRSYRSAFGRDAVTVLQYADLTAEGSSTRGLWSACGLPEPDAPSILDTWHNVTAEKTPAGPAVRLLQRIWD